MTSEVCEGSEKGGTAENNVKGLVKKKNYFILLSSKVKNNHNIQYKDGKLLYRNYSSGNGIETTSSANLNVLRRNSRHFWCQPHFGHQQHSLPLSSESPRPPTIYSS